MQQIQCKINRTSTNCRAQCRKKNRRHIQMAKYRWRACCCAHYKKIFLVTWQLFYCQNINQYLHIYSKKMDIHCSEHIVTEWLSSPDTLHWSNFTFYTLYFYLKRGNNESLITFKFKTLHYKSHNMFGSFLTLMYFHNQWWLCLLLFYWLFYLRKHVFPSSK